MSRKFILILVLTLTLKVGYAFGTIINAEQDINICGGGGYADYNMNWTELTINTEGQNSGLVQFNLNSFSDITSATLNLYHLHNVIWDGADFGIYKNTSAWNKNTVTWNTSPSYDPLPVAILNISDNNSDLWRDVEITALVMGWVNGTYENYGLRIQRIDNIHPVIYFASSYSNPDLAPFLDVTGTTTNPVPEPASIMLFGIGLAGFIGAKNGRRKSNNSPSNIVLLE